jgi:hypothetical protein
MSIARAGRVPTLLLSTFLASACGGPSASDPTTFTVRLENIAPFTQLKSGVYNTRVGGSAPGPLAPGEAFEFSFTAGKGQKLAFASMFGQSNDWLFATPPGGIDLYEGNMPRSGDITSSISIWDVGTEVDEEPAVGPHTGPNQASSLDGPGAADPNPSVRRLESMVTLTNGASFAVPAVSSMLRATLRVDPDTRKFTVRIENVSQDGVTLQTSAGGKPVRISPGVWTLTTGGEPLFTAGQKDRGLGLEAIAEMGQVTDLSASLTRTTGVGTPISPGIFAVHSTAASPFFTLGESDRGQGLERIAEAGDISPLLDALKARSMDMFGGFTMPEGASGAGPARPGSAYTFQVMARPGERLSLVTMFGMSNDWFFGSAPEGIALFDDAGQPISGDLSAALRLYDVGTELDEEFGIGPHTGPQQASADDGLPDTNTQVREASDGVAVSAHLKLTISH